MGGGHIENVASQSLGRVVNLGVIVVCFCVEVQTCRAAQQVCLGILVCWLLCPLCAYVLWKTYLGINMHTAGQLRPDLYKCCVTAITGVVHGLLQELPCGSEALLMSSTSQEQTARLKFWKRTHIDIYKWNAYPLSEGFDSHASKIYAILSILRACGHVVDGIKL